MHAVIWILAVWSSLDPGAVKPGDRPSAVYVYMDEQLCLKAGRERLLKEPHVYTDCQPVEAWGRMGVGPAGVGAIIPKPPMPSFASAPKATTPAEPKP